MARCWETSNALPSIFGGAGSSAKFAAWQSAFVAEAACLGALDHVQVLLDLVKEDGRDERDEWGYGRNLHDSVKPPPATVPEGDAD